jgi:hypothetical protein
MRLSDPHIPPAIVMVLADGDGDDMVVLAQTRLSHEVVLLSHPHNLSCSQHNSEKLSMSLYVYIQTVGCGVCVHVCV